MFTLVAITLCLINSEKLTEVLRLRDNILSTTCISIIKLLTTIMTSRGGTNTLGIIFFCLTFGTVLGSIGRKAESVITFFKVLPLLFRLSRKILTQVIDEVIMKMVNGIMWISPIGISSVICAKILGVANLSR